MRLIRKLFFWRTPCSDCQKRKPILDDRDNLCFDCAMDRMDAQFVELVREAAKEAAKAKAKALASKRIP